MKEDSMSAWIKELVHWIIQQILKLGQLNIYERMYDPKYPIEMLRRSCFVWGHSGTVVHRAHTAAAENEKIFIYGICCSFHNCFIKNNKAFGRGIHTQSELQPKRSMCCCAYLFLHSTPHHRCCCWRRCAHGRYENKSIKIASKYVYVYIEDNLYFYSDEQKKKVKEFNGREREMNVELLRQHNASRHWNEIRTVTMGIWASVRQIFFVFLVVLLGFNASIK